MRRLLKHLIDQSKPTLAVNSPVGQQNITPSSVPFSVVFTAQDNDAAGGGVVHEVLKLAGCTVYDGYAYGDNDGLLSDESMSVTKAEMGKIATPCGFTELNRPALTVEATDCAGNVGIGSFTCNGSLKLVPWACSP